jgi:hypothetical protein
VRDCDMVILLRRHAVCCGSCRVRRERGGPLE